MKNIFQLTPIEKITQKTLLILLLILAVVIIMGVYNQDNENDQNFILVPCMYVIGLLFLIIYTINGFTSGNIVRNWIIGNKLTGPVFHSILTIIKSRNKMTPDNAIILTTKIFATFSMCLAFFLGFKFIYYLLG